MPENANPLLKRVKKGSDADREAGLAKPTPTPKKGLFQRLKEKKEQGPATYKQDQYLNKPKQDVFNKALKGEKSEKENK